MTWDVWKSQSRNRPEGKWRQLYQNVEIAGLRYRSDDALDFVDYVPPADRLGLDWGIELEHDPDNPHSRNGRAIKVHGRWTRRHIIRRLFRADIVEDIAEQVHLGFVPNEITELMGKKLGSFYHSVPLAAELSEMVVAEDAGERRSKGLGVIIRIHILAPPKRDPIWKEIEEQEGQ